MNTLLHVFEAYTEFYRVSHDEEVGERLKWIMDVFADKVYNPKLKRQEVFFDKNYNTIIDLYSYGHDIETAWLMNAVWKCLGMIITKKNVTDYRDSCRKCLRGCV